MSRDSFLIRPGHETFASITATHMTARNDLRSLALEKRKCFFPGNHFLQNLWLWFIDSIHRKNYSLIFVWWWFFFKTLPCTVGNFVMRWLLFLLTQSIHLDNKVGFSRVRNTILYHKCFNFCMALHSNLEPLLLQVQHRHYFNLKWFRIL
jgi:hypothetical protein